MILEGTDVGLGPQPVWVRGGIPPLGLHENAGGLLRLPEDRPRKEWAMVLTTCQARDDNFIRMSEPWRRWIPGVLNREQTRALFNKELISGSPNLETLLDESSFDLTLSDEAYQMLHGSVKPLRGEEYSKVLRDKDLAEEAKPEPDGTYVLEAKKTYVFRLNEELNTKRLAEIGIYGQATAKSSVGRVDVLARLIVDGMDSYEGFTPERLQGASGRLYLEVTPITFWVRVRPGVALSQLRLFYGDPRSVEVRSPWLYRAVFLGDKDKEDESLTVDLDPVDIGGTHAAAFCAGAQTPDVGSACPIMLWEDPDLPKPDPTKYWQPESAKHGRLTIEKDKFYILRSRERIAVPKGIAVYCRATDETIGEMRIHYAGFAHPCFGDREQGTPLIFEVRGHQVDVSLAHGERLANLIFYRMSEDADPDKVQQTVYQRQTLTLSKFFAKWPRTGVSNDREGE